MPLASLQRQSAPSNVHPGTCAHCAVCRAVEGRAMSEPTPQGSDTPETDARSRIDYVKQESVVLSSFARTLERSRNAAILSANEAHLVVTDRRKECNALSARVEKLEALLAEARSTIDTWITSDKRSAELISLQAKVTELGADRDALQERVSSEWAVAIERDAALATVEQLRKDKEELTQIAEDAKRLVLQSATTTQTSICQVGQMRILLREALEKFGRHLPGCRIGISCVCSCGFDAAIATERVNGDA